MAHFNSSINWLIYGLMNGQFRKAYKRVVRRLANVTSSIIFDNI